MRCLLLILLATPMLLTGCMGQKQLIAEQAATIDSLYVIDTGGLRLLMWGDNRPNPPQEVWDRIGQVDVVFVPVDGSRHILDYEQADMVVEKTGAKVAIPHHYLVPETTFFTSTLEPATEWAQTHEHTMLDSASIELDKASIADKKGHVMYFGSHNKVTEGS